MSIKNAPEGVDLVFFLPYSQGDGRQSVVSLRFWSFDKLLSLMSK